MAKKMIFLLVLMLVLLLASVTAFATGTDSATSETGFTEEKADLENTSSTVSVSSLEKKYSNIFFDEEAASDKKIITIKYQREYSVVNDLRHTFTGTVIETTTSSAIGESPVIMLMYIKIDGEYVPLKDVVTGTHLSEGSYLLPSSMVDLTYLGSGKVNEVRIIAFRKKDAEKLVINESIQILDLQVTVPHLKLTEKKKITSFDAFKIDSNLPVAP